ncbi:MAG TPA: hypothetical protein VHQ65_14215 [Thermoanaerobaculia bacterium]|nr:hypothetical protein [Thermoanaerobaculia bacterium]
MSRLLRAFLFVVATLTLWYLGHFLVRAVWFAFVPPETASYTTWINLVLLPLAAVVAWALLRRASPPRR